MYLIRSKYHVDNKNIICILMRKPSLDKNSDQTYSWPIRRIFINIYTMSMGSPAPTLPALMIIWSWQEMKVSSLRWRFSAKQMTVQFGHVLSCVHMPGYLAQALAQAGVFSWSFPLSGTISRFQCCDRGNGETWRFYFLFRNSIRFTHYI